MMQVLFITGLHAAGAAVGLLFRGRVPIPFIAATGFLWGALLWVALVLVLLLLPVQSLGGAAAIGSCAAAVALIAAYGLLGTWRITGADAAWLAGGVAATATAAAAAGAWNYSLASFDSIVQLMMGRTIAFEGVVVPLLAEPLGSRGAFLPALHSAAVLIGEGYLHSVQPAFAVSFAMAFVVLGSRMARHVGMSANAASGLPLLALVALGTTYFILFQAFYIHDSFPSMVYLTAGTCTLWLALHERDESWLIFAIPAFIAFSILRIEGPLFAMIFLAPALTHGRLDFGRRLAAALVYAGSVGTWYLLLLVLHPGSGFLAAGNNLAVLGLLAGLVGLVGASRVRWVERLMDAHLFTLMLATAVAAIAVLCVLKPGHMQINAGVIGQNLFHSGRWGVTWTIMLLAALFAFPQPRIPHGRLLVGGVALFVLLVLALGALRVPYRVGWGDSANRMMTHILPLAALYVTLRCGAGLQAQAATGGRVRRLSLACSCAAVLAALGALYWLQPSDYAKGAHVLEEPPFALGRPGDRHDFSVALRGVSDDGYAAAAVPGPATVVLDLGRAVHAELLEMIEYNAAHAFTDYAWHVSLDRSHWHEVFDARTTGEASRRAAGDTAVRVRLPADRAFRYVRLTFRSALGQDRLLLRSVRIWSRSPYERRPKSSEKPR
jgi:hypothetical protein